MFLVVGLSNDKLKDNIWKPISDGMYLYREETLWSLYET